MLFKLVLMIIRERKLMELMIREKSRQGCTMKAMLHSWHHRIKSVLEHLQDLRIYMDIYLKKQGTISLSLGINITKQVRFSILQWKLGMIKLYSITYLMR